MLMSPFRKNEPKIHDARSAGARPPRVPTASMIATGPVTAKMNATTPLTICSPPRSASAAREMGPSLFLLPLEDCGDPLPSADAHRDQRVALLRALELVERFHGEDAARGADRMAERDCAAVRIHAGRIEPEVLRHRHRLGRERLVRFDHVHVRRLQA